MSPPALSMTLRPLAQPELLSRGWLTEQMARLLFGSAADPPEDQHSHLLGLLCCGLLSAATVAFCLEEAARKHMLRTFTADTLKAALMAFSAGNILLQLYYPATLTPLAAMALALAMAATFALPAGQLLGREDADRVWRDFRRLPHNLYYLTTLRKFSFAGALYLLLTWMFPLAGLLYFVAPKYILYHTFGYVYGKSTQFLWKAIGGGLMSVVPAMTYTLKDKAENDLLGRSIPRSLNFGLMLASIGHLLVFGPILARGHGGFLLPLLTSSWATSLVAAMAGLATPETVTSLEGTGASISAAKDKVVGAVGEAADAAAAAVHEE
ncbi:hypothetical protein N2152v2_006460 [Parachlorella kessleri]